jgi:hypothetical protein
VRFASSDLVASREFGFPPVAPDSRPKQPTQPKGKKRSGKRHKPVEIPVPKRDEVDRLLERAARSAESK